MDTGNHEKGNADCRLGIRPHCHCCGGGEKRKGRKYTRAKSDKLSRKAMRSKPKEKDHRL